MIIQIIGNAIDSIIGLNIPIKNHLNNFHFILCNDKFSILQLMQDYGVNLICVEDGIDSSKEAGKLLISIIAAVAEMER